jgi:type IV pilus assembly protein PilE
MVAHFKSLFSKKFAAYTLTELLIVLVIIGILILLAMPVLMPLITRTRSLEAKQGLKHLYSLQKTYFYEHSKFSGATEEIGFEQEKLIGEDGNGKANYRLEIVDSGPNTFLARATAVVDFDGDGTYNVWEIDQDENLREVIKD